MLNTLFKDKKKTPKEIIQEGLSELLEKGGFSLSFQIEEIGEDEGGGLKVDIFGEDEGLLKTKKGKLLLALQTYFLRVIQKDPSEERVRIVFDSNGFWDEMEEQLMSLTDNLTAKALENNRPVTFKHPLSPNQRRLVHERVSGNTGVRSVSLGEGFFKTIKLIPDTYTSNDR